MRRNRLAYFLICCALVGFGLATRRWAELLPRFVATYGGDTLWATMVFCGLGFLFPCWRTRRLFICSLLFCCAIETSQLYHAPWIDAIRDTRLGGLILGYGFLWSDMLCYTVGVCLGGLLDLLLQQSIQRIQKA